MAAALTAKKKPRFASTLHDALTSSNDMETVETIEAEITANDNNIITNKKKGRPSMGKTKRISFLVPEEMYEELELAATLLYKGNKTSYLNALIRQDLEDNKDKYMQLIKLLSR